MTGYSTPMPVRDIIGEAPLAHGLVRRDELDDYVGATMRRVGEGTAGGDSSHRCEATKLYADQGRDTFAAASAARMSFFSHAARMRCAWSSGATRIAADRPAALVCLPP